jgi:hypothetical protein
MLSIACCYVLRLDPSLWLDELCIRVSIAAQSIMAVGAVQVGTCCMAV